MQSGSCFVANCSVAVELALAATGIKCVETSQLPNKFMHSVLLDMGSIAVSRYSDDVQIATIDKNA